MGARRRRLVEMKRLRVELRGEPLDLLGRERVLPEYRGVTDAHVLEIFHAGLPAGARRPIIMVLTIVMTHAPA